MFPKQTAEMMSDLGAVSVNETKSLNVLTRAANTAHGNLSNKLAAELAQKCAKEGREATKAEVRSVFKQANDSFPPLYSPPGGVGL